MSKSLQKLKDNLNSYGWISIGLHWICASLILFLFGLGVYMRGLEYDSPWYYRAPEIHIAVGLVVFSLMVLRFAWRAKNISPSPLAGQNGFILIFAKVIKLTLYFLVFLVCITGYLITTSEGKSAYFFNLFSIPSIATLSPDASDLAGKTHKYAAWTIIFLVVIHAGAALLHHFVFRDETLIRMLRPKK